MLRLAPALLLRLLLLFRAHLGVDGKSRGFHGLWQEGLQQAKGICLLPLTRQRFDVKSNMPDLLTICFYLLDIHCNTLPERHAMTFLSNEGLKILCKIFLPASSQEGFVFQNSSFLVYAGHILCHIGIAGSSVFRPKFFEGSADPGPNTTQPHKIQILWYIIVYFGIS